MTDIFLSYNENDRAQARQVAATLESAGWTVWWDRRIPAGETWRSVLEDALEEMRCMVVLWSSHSIESEWVYEEASEGRRLGKLIPVMIEPVRPPAGFREIQAADLTGWDGSREFEGMRMLLADLENFLGKPPKPITEEPPENRENRNRNIADEGSPPWWQGRSGVAAVAGLVLLGSAVYFALSSRAPANAPPEAKAAAQEAPRKTPNEKPEVTTNAASTTAPTVATPSPTIATEPPAKPHSPVVTHVATAPTLASARQPATTRPAARNPDLTRPTGARCADLLAKTQLGEALSEKSQAYYDKECRQ